MQIRTKKRERKKIKKNIMRLRCPKKQAYKTKHKYIKEIKST